MKDKQPTPLDAAFWLTDQEKHYIIIICALVLLGLVVRFFYLKNDKPESYKSEQHENVENVHE